MIRYSPRMARKLQLAREVPLSPEERAEVDRVYAEAMARINAYEPADVTNCYGYGTRADTWGVVLELPAQRRWWMHDPHKLRRALTRALGVVLGR